MTKSRLAVVYHLFNNFDINQATIDLIRKSYEGPLIISEDLMVFNVSKEKIRMREALVGDKVIGLRKKKIAGKVTKEERIPVSEWLEAGEIKFDDVNTALQ